MKLFLKDQRGTLRPLHIIVQHGDHTTSLTTFLNTLVHRLAQAEEAVTRVEERHTEPLSGE